jgi:hypothetical protein
MNASEATTIVATAIQRLRSSGPDRVLVWIAGAWEGIPSERARREHGVVPDVVFIRTDGWMLGAQAGAGEVAAAELYRDTWLAAIRREDPQARPLQELSNG